MLLVCIQMVFVLPVFGQGVTPGSGTPVAPTAAPGSGTPATTPSPGGTTTTPSPVAPTTAAPGLGTAPVIPEGTWIPDAEVTFVGRSAWRAKELLTWALTNHEWMTIAGDKPQALRQFWVEIVYRVVAPFFLLLFLAGAFVLVITRGKNSTAPRFILRFLGVVLLVLLSFSLVQFLYQITDIIQGIFLRDPSNLQQKITADNLLSVAFGYKDFLGYRKNGASFDESVYMSLLLVKLTSATYYLMVGLLLVRKIILWFFIVLSPVFPLLLLYKPIRNTGLIWLGEFFRWLLYAPLFAILLQGLVKLWQVGIPLAFNLDNVGKPESVTFETAINILIGGPGQQVSLTNSINYIDTFALYFVALLMIWVVIFLPFLLLQIFLNYVQNVSFAALADNNLVQRFMAASTSLVGKNGYPSVPPGTPPSGSYPTGMAKNLPFANRISTMFTPKAEPGERPTGAAIPFARSAPQVAPQFASLSRLANLPIPSIRDIARFETQSLSSSSVRQSEARQVKETLDRISNPANVTSTVERDRFTSLREKLVQESKQGNPLATSILSAANIRTATQQSVPQLHDALRNVARPAVITDPVKRQRFTIARNQLLTEQHKGNPLASSVLSAAEQTAAGNAAVATTQTIARQLDDAQKKNDPFAAPVIAALSQTGAQQETQQFPAVNRVQQVSIEDYESVKKMWEENYQKLEPPKNLQGSDMSRSDWVNGDVTKISHAIDLLSSADTQKAKEGMNMVSQILPFLLIGGFSQTEVIAYLKAKLEAAKDVRQKFSQQQEEEDTTVARTQRQEGKKQEMHAAMPQSQAEQYMSATEQGQPKTPQSSSGTQTDGTNSGTGI